MKLTKTAAESRHGRTYRIPRTGRAAELRLQKAWDRTTFCRAFAVMLMASENRNLAFDSARKEMKRTESYCLVSVLMVWLAGCSGQQSALDPAGREAEQIARLFWWMTIAAVAIWVAVEGLCFWAIRASVGADNAGRVRMLIIGGGAVVPTLVLAGLLVYGLGIMPPLLARAPEGSLRIAVTGEQWWWRVRYLNR